MKRAGLAFDLPFNTIADAAIAPYKFLARVSPMNMPKQHARRVAEPIGHQHIFLALGKTGLLQPMNCESRDIGQQQLFRKSVLRKRRVDPLTAMPGDEIVEPSSRAWHEVGQIGQKFLAQSKQGGERGARYAFGRVIRQTSRIPARRRDSLLLIHLMASAATQFSSW